LCRIIASFVDEPIYDSTQGKLVHRRAKDVEVVEQTNRRLAFLGFSDESAEGILRARQYVDKVRAAERARVCLEDFRKAVGPRYADCTLENYVVGCPAQRKAVDVVLDFARHAAERATAGTNVILFGPSGTGKDHLACGLARAVIQAGIEVRWQNGRDMFGQFRAAIDDDRESEDDLLKALFKPAVLLISDPLPPSGPLTAFQQDLLFRAVDVRYRLRKPTWLTLNVKDGTEADERIGVSIVDRLRHGALTLACNWASYRKPLGQE
jgi:DNA replication protein DnaC